MPNGLKEIPRIICTVFIGLTLISFLLFGLKNLILKISFFLIFLISSIDFSNFIIDFLFEPTIPAFDCEGHTPMNMNWIKGFLFGPIYSIIVGSLYLKDKTEKKIIDITIVIFCLSILFLSFLKLEYIQKISTQIDLISMPKVILPEEC